MKADQAAPGIELAGLTDEQFGDSMRVASTAHTELGAWAVPFMEEIWRRYATTIVHPAYATVADPIKDLTA